MQSSKQWKIESNKMQVQCCLFNYFEQEQFVAD